MLLALGIANLTAQEAKKVLTHEDNSIWKYIKHTKSSLTGNFISYEVNPLEGDGYLYIYNNTEESLDSIYRAKQADFSPSEQYFAFAIKPERDTLLAKRRAEVEKDDLPKDTLGIYFLKTKKIEKIARMASFKMPDKGGDWMAYQLEKELPKEDTTSTKSDTTDVKPKKEDKVKPLKSKKGLLVILNPVTGDSISFKHIGKYQWSQNGEVLAMMMKAKDSVERTAVITYNTAKRQADTLFAAEGEIKNLVADAKGEQLAFMYSGDTTDTKVYDLHYCNLINPKKSIVLDAHTQGMPEGSTTSVYGDIEFSESGERMYFGTAAIPVQEPKDTLLKEEKVSVDIWHWKDKVNMPQQLLDVEDELERNYLAVYYPAKNKMVQLGSTSIPDVDYYLEHDDKYLLGYNEDPYRLATQWNAQWSTDLYLIDAYNGKSQLILKEIFTKFTLSPDRKYIAYFDPIAQDWKSKNIKTGKTVSLTAGLKGINFYNEDHDMPVAADAYGTMGWLKGDKGVLIYDRYDIWQFDPNGKKAPINITKSYGRENQLQFRNNRLDDKKRYVDPEEALYAAFNEKTKGDGFYHLKNGEVKELIAGDYMFTRARKPEKGDVLVYTRQNYQEFPDLWVANMDMSKTKRISNANPQKSEYNWGTVELVEWKSFDGKDLQGLLYRPENLDPNKKYPMLVYFYETYSEMLNRHFIPKPTYSTINFTYYASNGYVIFVPDIKYGTGNPGHDAFDAIISGTQAMCNKYDFIDRDHLGIQGQSWGGYQTAYLVTQTDMFAAAEAGAPVSNMTSAYGGIRWGSGMSRQFQYENTQSRIGGTLWEKPMNYYNNSPVFFADRVNTPLMIMHNDDDGAVPWYQGIEYFMALKRLQKPVWLVNYNGAPHNLSRLADRKDLTIRLQQFFDHFLKGGPAPEWLENGLPAVKKGKSFGFEPAKKK